MHERVVIFECAGDELVGIVHAPQQAVRDTGVVVVVGGPQYRVGSHRQFVLMARALAAAGHPVLRFDYRGMGDSAGAPRTFESVEADIRAAIDAFLGEWPALRGVVLFGLCDAAAAALMYCAEDPRVRGLILANPWVHTEAGAAQTVVRHYYGRRLLQRSFWSKVLVGKFQLLGSLRSLLALLRAASGSRSNVAAGATHFLTRMREGAQRFTAPVLVLLSDRDLTAREFEEFCRGSPEWSRWLVSGQVAVSGVENSDHTFSSCAALGTATRRALQWLEALEAAPVTGGR